MPDVPEYRDMLNMADEALASINVLFCEPDDGGELVIADIPGSRWMRGVQNTFLAIRRDLAELEEHPASAERFSRVSSSGNRADSIDMMNMLVQLSGGESFAVKLEDAVWCSMVRLGISGRDLADLSSPKAVDARFYFKHAVRLSSCMSIFRSYPEALVRAAKTSGALSRLRPEFLRLAAGDTIFAGGRVTLDELGGVPAAEAAEKLASKDLFAGGRAFRFAGGRFQIIDVENIRKADDFYGYAGVKRSFADHFSRFASGTAGEPLLVSGLPGLGKTQFTMAFVLARQDLILVLAGPEELEKGLEELLEILNRSAEHRFVVFFDDIDPRTLDWYWFRTNVGGALAMPENVMIALAANYDFPASILSRGRGISFPVFDVVRCEEMIEDFLKAKGLRQPSPELVGVIAADYTEEFGQKKFPELSPRTLIRYLGWYDKDLNKRRRLLEQSKLELVSRPDTQLFQEFNLKQIKLLYGGEKVLETVGESLDG